MLKAHIKKGSANMVDTMELIVVFIVVGFACYVLGIANGFEDGKEYEKEKRYKNEY